MSGPVRGYVVAEATWWPGTADPLRWEPHVVSRDLPDDVVHRVLGDPASALPPASARPRPSGGVDRPYRLALSPFGDQGLVCLRATTAARPDASGAVRLRLAGLVVAPAALSGELLRPVDLWDAELWSADPGPRPATDLRRGSLDHASLTAFSRAHPDQREVVFAAVEHALRGGDPLLVVGDEPAAAAHWAWLIGRLLLPATAWRLPFSTYERLTAPRPAGAVPFAVAGVPSADAADAVALAGRDFTVLADDEQPVRAGRDRWAIRTGPTVPAGAWARVAETVVVAGLLSDVTRRLDELAAVVGGSAVRRPLWALGAAVLLLDDVDELGDVAADAADLARDEWPQGLAADSPLLARVAGLVTAHARPARPPVAADPAPGSRPSRPDGSREEARTRVPPEAGESLARGWSRLSGAVRRGVDAAREAARERRAEDDLPGSVLEVAALLDGSAARAEDRREVLEQAREVLVPALFDLRTDPVRAGWSPVPDWLWTGLLPALNARLEDGRELPGRHLSAATHTWLGSHSVPAGQLTVGALQRTDAVDWERAAHRVLVRAAGDVTPLERAAAFLAIVCSVAVNVATPIERWAAHAAETVYPGDSLDIATAVVLMEVLPTDAPFSWALAPVLHRTPPSAATRAAVAALRRREVVPIALAPLVEQHERRDEPGDVLITEHRQLLPLLVSAARSDKTRSAWIPIAQALLRVDVRVLPMNGLPASVWDDGMPWGEGWARLDVELGDPRARTVLAAHLLCRGARARLWPRDDWAAGWLTRAGDARRTYWAETVAGRLLSQSDPQLDVVALVRVLTEQAPRKPITASPDSRHREDTWREDALTWARRLATARRPSPPRRA